MFDLETLLAALPPPRDDEPPSLRSEIVEELLDHLHCAFRREILKDGDEAAAEKRVLFRFGDPKQLARRLWWQAMWSRIMGKRILSGLQWLLTLAAVFLAGAVLWQQSQLLNEMNAQRAAEATWRQNLSLTLNDLRSRLPAPAQVPSQPMSGAMGSGVAGAEIPGVAAGGAGAFPMAARLIVKLVQEKKDGPLVERRNVREIKLTSSGNSIRGRPQLLLAAGPAAAGGMGAEETGQYEFDNLEPDRYELKITLADGQRSTQPVLIRDDEPREMTVICPGPRKKVPVVITAESLPDDLADRVQGLMVTLEEQPIVLNMVEWHVLNSNLQQISLDQGKVVWINEQNREGTPSRSVDLREVRDEDRAVFLSTGPVGLIYQLDPKPGAVGGGNVERNNPISFPSAEGFQRPSPIIRNIELGETKWQLELPDELLAAARKQLARSREIGLMSERTIRDWKNEPRGIVGLILVRETEDGPPVSDAEISLLRNGKPVELPGQPRLDRLSKPDYDEGILQKKIKGSYLFAGLEPDRYELQIMLPNGQRHIREVTVENEKPQMITIICPGERKRVPLRLTAPPLPDDLQKAGLVFGVGLTVEPMTLAGADWVPLPWPMYSGAFDPQTGLLTTIQQKEVTIGLDGEPQDSDLSKVPEAERMISPFAGPVKLHYLLGFKDATKNEDGKFSLDAITEIRNITPDGDHWELKFPEELLAAARKKLAELEGKPVDEVPAKSMNDDKQGAARESLGDKCRLIVKLTSETKDGPVLKDARVLLLKEGVPHVPPSPQKASDEKTAATDPVQNLLVSAEGRREFGPLEPGRYGVMILLPDGRSMVTKPAVRRAGREYHETILCPAPIRHTRLRISAPPVPENLRRAGVSWSAKVESVPETFAGQSWTLSPPCVRGVNFDPATGHVKSVSRAFDNYPSLDEQQRIFSSTAISVPDGWMLPLGRYRLTYELGISTQPPNTEASFEILAKSSSAADHAEDEMTMTMKPGQNAWEIKVPDDFWAEARKKLAGLEGK